MDTLFSLFKTVDAAVPIMPVPWVNSALVLALISMLTLISVFYFLNRRIKRQYFTLWMIAWVCYALYLLAAIGLQEWPDNRLLLLGRRACIGVSGLFMFWGSFQLTYQPRTMRELRTAVALVIGYCAIATFSLPNPLLLTSVAFAILGGAGIYTGHAYLTRRTQQHGAIILGVGFLLWGSHMLLFPLLELSSRSMAASYLLSAGLAVMIAIGMVVEQEVSVAERNYRILFDAGTDAVFLVDMWKLTVIEANKAAERLTKHTLGKLPGMAFRDICPSIQGSTGNVVENQRAFKQVFRPYEEFAIVQDGGTQIACEGEVSLAEWRQRLVFQVNIRDVGERRNLTQQVRRAEKLSALGQLVAGVAHELNNPLAIVMGKAQLLANRAAHDPVMATNLRAIHEQSERAARIVRDLLSYARPSEPNKMPMDLNRTVRSVLEWRKNALEAAEIEVFTELAKSLPATQADVVQIEQVITNLVNNAIDALHDRKPPRQVLVTTQETTSYLRLSLTDNGTGIAPEVVEKIFDPFFTTKPLGRGTGLGLSICNTYIQEHHGKIWVETRLSEGTTFYVDLPLLACEAPPAEQPAPSPALASAAARVSGRRLLIIDDEPEILNVLATVLSETGFEITTAENGNQALEILSHQQFDAVLSDIRMPGLDGQALYRKLCESKPAMARRVIFVTGDTVSSSTRQFLDGTGNLWLSKPFRIADVTDRVTQVINAQTPGIN